MKTRRRAARGKGLDPKTALKIALLTAAAIFLGWLCVRAATLEALVRRNPVAAAQIAPHDPRIPLSLANLEFRAGQGAIGPATSKRGVDAIQGAPLAADPFLFAGIEALVRGDRQKALALVGEARRRNPRSRTARLIYLDQLLRAEKTEGAAVEIAAISRLVPEASKVLLPELARYAADPQTAPALIRALRPDANLRDSVLAQLATDGADPAVIMRLAASGPPGESTKGTPVWQDRLLNRLVNKGEVARARILWAGFAGVDPAQRVDGVYDGAFRRAPGPAPFNWAFTQSAAGVAEPTKAPALQVEYYGRADAELASQLLQLGPGRHSLDLIASGSVPASGGQVAWTLTCLRGKAPIAAFPMSKVSYTPRRFAMAFSVPADCPAQWLRLVGTSSEFPAAHSITIADLQIRKVSAS